MQPSAGSQLRAARIVQRHSKTRSTRLLVVLCAAAAAGLSQMGGRGAYYKAKYGGAPNTGADKLLGMLADMNQKKVAWG